MVVKPTSSTKSVEPLAPTRLRALLRLTALIRLTESNTWTKVLFVVLSLTSVLYSSTSAVHADEIERQKLRKVVDDAINPVMKKFDIAGMAVGVSNKGKHYVFNYGVVSRATNKPVGDRSLFEIGSVSKTLTATLASYAQVIGKLSLEDKTSKYLPELKGSAFGDLTLLNLGTHTSGGLPLQLPESIKNNTQLMEYLKQWKPKCKSGTVRNYANPGVGMLGFITAKCMQQNFDQLIETSLFKPLGMSSTYINISNSEVSNYAQGYTEKNDPVRMTRAVLSSEAYGVKTTAADMIRFIDLNMSIDQDNDSLKVDEKLHRAILNTHTGYFKTRAMTQDLIWEQYPLPLQEKNLLVGNSRSLIYETNPVTKITPPEKPMAKVWINKTGSTSGFGSYVAFIPEEKVGIVVLANKSYPIPDRLAVAQAVIRHMLSQQGIFR